MTRTLINWTPEMEQIVRRGWREGTTTNIIGKRLASLNNGLVVSRGAVIGRAHKLNLGIHPHARVGKPKSEWKARKGRIVALRKKGQPATEPPVQRGLDAANFLGSVVNIQQHRDQLSTAGEHPPVALPGGLGLLALEPHHCRYVISDEGTHPRDYLFCGQPIKDHSLCAEHHALCRITPPPAKSRREFRLWP